MQPKPVEDKLDEKNEGFNSKAKLLDEKQEQPV
jgi:hypothetical protein